MNITLRASVVALAAVGSIVALTACSSGGGTAPTASDSYVSGGTFSVALNDDPGNLSPLTGVSLVQRGIVPFAYESLVYITPDGDTLPWLAESWEETGTSITYTLKEGIVCADGSAFTGETVANNVAYQANADNGTFWHGSNITADMTAEGDATTVTITTATNNPFLLQSTGAVEMVCQAGLDDPDSLADATDGTGLYQLSSSSPGASYTYTKRDDYTWGPEDVTSETEGLPDEIVGQVITDNATAANLLISGDLNAAAVIGADEQRVQAAGLDGVGILNPIGEMLFNERADRPTSDVRVRQALTMSLDRASVGELVTDGNYLEPTSLINKTPMACVAGGPLWTLPDTDLDAAGALLDEAGWTLGSDGLRAKDGEPLTIRFIYDAGTPSHAAGAEEIQAEWNELGITTELVAEDPTGWSTDLYQSYNWDTGFIQLAPGSPVVLSLFFYGAHAEDGGYNFMAVDNPEYDALAEQAFTAADQETACGLWQEAEKLLVDRVDIYPLAETETLTYLNGADLEMPGSIMPTTIRMLG